MSDENKEQLVKQVQALVGSTGIEALTSFIGQQVNREIFLNLIREFAQKVVSGGWRSVPESSAVHIFPMLIPEFASFFASFNQVHPHYARLREDLLIMWKILDNDKKLNCFLVIERGGIVLVSFQIGMLVF